MKWYLGWLALALLWCAMAAFFFAMAQLAHADSCRVGVRSYSPRHFQHHYQASHVKQHAQVQHFFFVGLPIRVEAIAAQAQAVAPAVSHAAQNETQAAPASGSGAGATIEAKCSKCHAPGRADGGFSLDDLESRRLDVVRRLVHPDPKERMPPPDEPQLTADERGSLQQEALGLK